MNRKRLKKNGSDTDFMTKLATFIVDKRYLFLLIAVITIIFSLFSKNWVEVENDLTFYLPDTAETKQALDIMEDQFTTYGTADIMVANVTYDKAKDLKEELEDIKGVQSVSFDDTTDHYAEASALFSITFDYDEDDDQCVGSLDRIKDLLSDQDIYVSSEIGNSLADTIAAQVKIIMVYVAVIVVIVLILTSNTYGEVPVLLLTFIAAMLMNQGTNFLLGKISFVSNSVTNILQLALSLDYAIILCNRFKEEHQTKPVREAAIAALSKAMIEIGSSSLTTVGGLVAMLFMQFRIGPDMGICLIKAIAFSLLSVFIVMPGLLVLFGPLMDKTGHRSFIPKISFAGRFAYATRKVVPFVFIGAIICACFISSKCPYAYGDSAIKTPKLSEEKIAENMIDETFTSENMLALIVPAGDHDKEAQLMNELEARKEVNSTTGLANTEAMDGYMLTDTLTPRQFSEMVDIDYELAQTIYAAYAAKQENYTQLAGHIATYRVTLIDMLLFVSDEIDKGLVTLDDDQMETLENARTLMESAKDQLQGEDYSRILVYLNLPVSGEETYEFTDTMHEIAEKYYPDGNIYVAGDSTNEYDFQKSFSRDNKVVSAVSLLIVMAVLLFTFKSVGMPILLLLVIQGSIWINFSIPVFTKTPLFFMSYLVVSSIQMGANIDYAIVIANRYQELKNRTDHRSAITETLNFAFPTVLTSGTIMAVAGTLIGRMTSEASIVGIGQSLGRGTIISMFLVIFVLPQILLQGSGFADKTSFSIEDIVKKQRGENETGTDPAADNEAEIKEGMNNEAE